MVLVSGYEGNDELTKRSGTSRNPFVDTLRCMRRGCKNVVSTRLVPFVNEIPTPPNGRPRLLPTHTPSERASVPSPIPPSDARPLHVADHTIACVGTQWRRRPLEMF